MIHFSGTGTGTARRKTINIRDVFIEPDFNELDMVAIDSKVRVYNNMVAIDSKVSV